MKKVVLITGALLLVVGGAFLAGDVALAGCPHAQKAAEQGQTPPCAAAQAAQKMEGISRAVYPISNGVVLVYTADSPEGIAQVRKAATIGCKASCSCVQGEAGDAHAGCAHHQKQAAEAKVAEHDCKSRIPKLAGVNRETVETPDGVIVIVTTTSKNEVKDLHAWAREANAATRASL